MKVYAHRGFSGQYPENTMLAFQKAAELGCYGIELDVHLTKDDKLVVIHDEKVNRTTDGRGWVKDLTWSQLQKLNAGTVFKLDAKIPSLEEYLDWVKDTDLVTNIEIKTDRYYYQDIEEKTLSLVRDFGLSDRVLFSSFNHSSLYVLRELAPDIPCGALLSFQSMGNVGYFCHKFDLAYYHPDFRILDEVQMASCQAYGIKVNCWTVNEPEDLDRCQSLGVEGVITNFPDRALAACK